MFVPFSKLSDTSKVWIYQASRTLDEAECAAIREELVQFVEAWTAHQMSLHAYGDIYHNRFLVLMADESDHAASGCSIDRSVHFLQDLEQRYRVSLFDRTDVAWTGPDGIIYTAPLGNLKAMVEEHTIDEGTLVFDNLVSTKKQFETAWMKPLSMSWHHRFI